jgi:drug/metabolite transporter (DMT)-like permease
VNALTLGLVAALCWGIHDVTVRRISQNAPLMATLLGVLGVGAVFQFSAMSVLGGFTALPREALAYSVGAGVAFTVASAGLYGAFHRGPVRIVAPVIGSFPILAVGLASVTGSVILPLQWVAVIAVVLGIAIVAVFADQDDADYPALGPTIGLSVLSSFGFFATFALGQEAARLADHLPSIFVTRLASVAVLVTAMLLLRLPIWPGRAALPFIAIMGVLDGIALLCVLSAGDLPSAEYAVVTSSIFGLITVILARMFLAESMTAKQWMGCVLSFAAIGYLALSTG